MDIVLFSFNKFHGRDNRGHHLARQLARRGRVFFVDPPLSVLAVRRVRASVEPVGEDLLNIRLPAGLPGRCFRCVHRLNEARWLRCLGRVLKRSRWGARGPRVCVHLTPVWGAAARVLAPDVTVYDAHDDWRSIPPNSPQLIANLEAEYARHADIILSASDKTAANFAAMGRRTHSLPNACDAEHFGRAMSQAPAAEMAALPQPRILYVGGVEQCFDTAAVLAAARRMPEASFVIVGPELVPQKALRNEPNVFLLGEQPYQQLPRYFAGADVCWIPFRLTPHAMGRDCIKLYEYLASGRPVVSTPLPRARQFSEHVVVADAEADSLVRACRRALADETPRRRQGRLALAKEHSWQRRAEELEGLLVSASEKKTSQLTPRP